MLPFTLEITQFFWTWIDWCIVLCFINNAVADLILNQISYEKEMFLSHLINGFY